MTNKDYYYLNSISNVLQSGKNISYALQVIKDDTKNIFEKKKLNNVLNDIKSGLSVAESFKKRKLISKELISYVSIAEKSPNMRESFKNIILYIEDKNSFLRKSKEKISLPIIYFTLAFITILVVKFYAIDYQIKQSMQYSAHIQAQIQSHLTMATLYADIIFSVLIINTFILFSFLYSIFGSNFNLQIFLKTITSYIPFISKIGEYFEKFFILSLLGQMLRSGVTLPKSISIIKNETSNIKMKNKFDEMLTEIKYGNKNFLTDNLMFTNVQKSLFLGVSSSLQLGENLIKLGQNLKEDAYYGTIRFFRFVTIFSIIMLASTVILEFYSVVITQMIVQKSFVMDSLGSSAGKFLQ